jgi:hypothetical protein
MARQIFRQTALEALAAPEDLYKLNRLIEPRGWLALIAVMVLLVLGVAWGVFGTLPEVVQARGVLFRPGRIQEIKVEESGQLSNFQLKVGDSVREGQLLARLKNNVGNIVELKSPADATVMEVLAENWQTLKAETVIARLDFLNNRPLQGLALVPLSQLGQLKPGQKVQLKPLAASNGNYGFLSGTTSKVSTFPASSESLITLLKDREQVAALLSDGPVTEVEIVLDYKAGALEWSSGHSPEINFNSGTPCQVILTIGERHPLSLFFGA